MRRRLPRSLFDVVGYDLTFKPALLVPTGSDLLTTPAPPPPLAIDDLRVDERLSAALGGNGSEPAQH